jgi:folate-binding protein YgfZ
MFSVVKNVFLVPVLLTGRDVDRYFQGRITQDARGLGEAESRQALILSPQGKIEGKFSFSKVAEGTLLLAEVSDSYSLLNFISSLFRFKVADDVVATDKSSELDVYTLFSFESLDHTQFEKLISLGVIVRPLKRANLYCVDLLIPRTLSEEELSKHLTLQISSYNDFDLQRIKAGYPLLGRDISDSTVAPDIDLTDYVSFKKGCYAGQEVVEMSIARGRPNRALAKLTLEGGLSEDFDMKFYDESLENNVGFITSHAFDGEKNVTYALGYIKAKYEPVERAYFKESSSVLNVEKVFSSM